MKTVKSFSDLSEAGFCSSLLEAAGIRNFIAGEDTYSSGYGAITGPLRVQVENQDYDLAVSVLEHGLGAAQNTASGDNLIPPETSEEQGMEERRVPWGVFLSVVGCGLVLFAAVHHVQKKRKESLLRGTREIETQDVNHDGRPDISYFWRDGVLMTAEVDRNFDGKLDEWIRYGPNQIVEEVRMDTNFDGVADAWYSYEFGNTASGKADLDFNGTVDAISTFRDGVIAQRDIARNGSPVIERREIFTHGELREEFIDLDRDGHFDIKVLYNVFGERSEPVAIGSPK